MTANPDPSAGRPSDIVGLLSHLGARLDAVPFFPTESLRLLRDAGLHRRFAPANAGGEAFADERIRFAALKDVLRLVGRGDLSVGRLFEGHVNALMLFGWYATHEQLQWLDCALDRGAWFGVWATEPPPGVRLHQGTPQRLEGAKMFASGAGGLDYAIVTAAVDGANRRLAIVPANDHDRADLTGWRVRGMRATASGRYDLAGLIVEPAMLLGTPGDYDREPRFTAGAWRFCAVQLGGIEALVTVVRATIGDAAKSDPVQRARFLDAVVSIRTAGFWVQEAAIHAADNNPNAATIARMTRGVVERAGLDVMEAAARILGTRSAFDGERSDKIIRDLSLFLRQAGADYARDEAARAMLDRDFWGDEDQLW